MAEVSFTAVHGADAAKAVQPTQSYLTLFILGHLADTKITNVYYFLTF